MLRLARGIEAGMVFVNTRTSATCASRLAAESLRHCREGGEYSFEVFAEMKNVCISMVTIRSLNGRITVHPSSRTSAGLRLILYSGLCKENTACGKLALAAKITITCRHRISELPGKIMVVVRLPSTAIKKLASAVEKWASILSFSIPTGWSTAPTT